VIISLVYLLVRCVLGCLMMLARHRVSKDAELLVLRVRRDKPARRRRCESSTLKG